MFGPVTSLAYVTLTDGLAFGLDSLGQLSGAVEPDAMTRGMMLGAGVLIATQAVIVVTAVIWYARSHRKEEPERRLPPTQRRPREQGAGSRTSRIQPQAPNVE